MSGKQSSAMHASTIDGVTRQSQYAVHTVREFWAGELSKHPVNRHASTSNPR